MGVTPERSRREFQVAPSEASIPIQDRLIPWVNSADVDLILLGRVSLLRIFLSVISVLSVVPRSSCLPESSPRLSAPARPRGRGRLAQFRLPQRFAVWWVALPWPILSVPAVFLPCVGSLNLHRLFGRQGDVKLSPLAHTRLDPDTTSLLLDERLHEVQTQA